MMEKHEALYKDVSSLEVISYFRHSSDFDDGVEFILDKLDAIPVADVQPVRHGKWIDKPVWLRGVGLCRYECSYCGYVVDSKPGSRGSGKGGKYCDECGAKMDGE